MEIIEKLTERTVTDADVDELEISIGGKLPKSYRAFLKQHNGGCPRQRKFMFIDASGKEAHSAIHYFYGVHEGDIGSLKRIFTLFEGRVPPSYLSIACDSFGNQLLLPLRGTPDAPIFFWDHELELETEESADLTANRAMVARRFLDFIQTLRE